MKRMINHETVCYGFIGAGQIAVEAAKSLATHSEAKVVAAQDLNAGRLAELCSAHGIGKASVARNVDPGSLRSFLMREGAS
jgi:predicted dehydrogenase